MRISIAAFSILFYISALWSENNQISDQEQEMVSKAIPKYAKVKARHKRILLIFSLAKGYVHKSTHVAVHALKEMGESSGAYISVISDNPEVFRKSSLSTFDAIAFVNTTGTLFQNETYKRNLVDFVKSGKGICGYHAATDSFKDWPEFANLMGASFDGHPWRGRVIVKLDDPKHELVQSFSSLKFEIEDEIYQFKEKPYSRSQLRVLLSLDNESVNIKKSGVKRKDKDFAISWIQNYGQGRVFYSSLGHNKEIWWNPVLLKYYLDGLQFAFGDLECDTSPGPPLQLETVDALIGEYEGIFHHTEEGTSGAKAHVNALGQGQYKIWLDPFKSDSIEFLAGHDLSNKELDIRTEENAKFKGLKYRLYAGNWKNIPDFTSLSPIAQGFAKYFDLSKSDLQENFALQFKGFLNIPQSGKYLFKTISDDGSRLKINQRVIVNNDGIHGTRESRAQVTLLKGLYPIELDYFQNKGDRELKVYYQKLPKNNVFDKKITLECLLMEDKWQGQLTPHQFKLVSENGHYFQLKKKKRFSPTLGQAPPENALELLPHRFGEKTNMGAWTNPSWLTFTDGSVQIKKGDNFTKESFGDLKLHLEFMLPYEPQKSSQARGNSGICIQNRYEIQIKDSFAENPTLENGGAITDVAPAKRNVALPPLTWQTYDIIFKAARYDQNGSLRSRPKLTVYQNGIMIHQNVTLPVEKHEQMHTRLMRKGSIKLQDFGSPVRFRNIWVQSPGEV